MRIILCLMIMLPILLAVGCTAGSDNLTARLAAANLLAATAARGLATAVTNHTIEPESETAAAIIQTLDAVELSLDSAGSALCAALKRSLSR